MHSRCPGLSKMLLSGCPQGSCANIVMWITAPGRSCVRRARRFAGASVMRQAPPAHLWEGEAAMRVLVVEDDVTLACGLEEGLLRVQAAASIEQIPVCAWGEGVNHAAEDRAADSGHSAADSPCGGARAG